MTQQPNRPIIVVDAAARRFLLPELDGEIFALTGPLEELLLALADGAEEEPALPAALHQPAADALGHLRVAIRNAPIAHLYAPDGHYEHEPLAVVTVDNETITLFEAAVAELSAALQPGGRPDVAEFLDDWADERHTTVEAIVALASRVHQLCHLSSGSDHDLLAPQLEAASAGGERTVLSHQQEAAYRRLRERFVAVWHDGDPLARWMY
jgi:hypothetical protein